jgi:Dyp-type peroxidase family
MPNAWLETLLRGPEGCTVTFGDEEPRGRATFVSMTAKGLEKMGLSGVCADDGRANEMPSGCAASFPPAFAFGMADKSRGRALGDTHENAPDKWIWGGESTPIDAAVLIYTKAANGSESPIDLALRKERERLQRYGLKVLKEVTFSRLPESGPIREPFGFVDGLSQPVIKGTGKSAKGAHHLHLVEPGEFILGYKDNRKRYPPTPHVPVSLDRKRSLPNLAPELTGLARKSNDWRDLGRNGSFLVIRQLEQHVDKFNASLKKFSDDERQQEWLAAKFVGRWKNGAPLVRYPYAPPDQYEHTDTENDFLFGQDDPQGLACPFGAHIRRANPRDGAEAASDVQIGITNRHRIMRRGRVYVAGDDPKAKGEGLLFMCLNADIERQFEYVQQTWISSNNFNGLDETDPVTSTTARDGSGCFTIPMASGPLRVEGLSSFVTVRGGGYFFLPSKSALRFLSYLRPDEACGNA